VSDTVIAYVDALEPDVNDSGVVPDLDSGVVREKLDADTTAEWVTINGTDVLVGIQQMHASVGSYVGGMPPFMAQLLTDIVLLAKDSDDPEASQAALLKTHEMTRRLDISLLNEKRRASRATSKGVEAALHFVIDSFEHSPRPLPSDESVAHVLRDLASSISDGEGLSSERTVEAAFNKISKTGMRSKTQKKELLSMVNDLRDQRTWQSAIDKALTTPELVLNSESDGELNDAD
jgi:hypothetical protein